MIEATDIPRTTRDRFIGGQLVIEQPKAGYRAGQDAVFLAAACRASRPDRVLEFGCGVGTALLCLGRRTGSDLTGVEIDQATAELARANAAENAVSARIITADLTNLPLDLREETFDHVLINPPYFGPGSASPVLNRDLARREQTPLADWIDVALRRLRPGGELTIIHLAERLSDILALLNARAGRFEIKPLTPRAQKPASRVVLRAIKGGASVTTLYNPLILHEGAHHHDGKSDFSDAAKQVLKHGQPLEF